MKYTLTLCISFLLIGFSVILGTATPSHAQDDEFEIVGDWEGAITTSTGAQLCIVFHLSRGEDDVLSSTMDSPDQGAFGLPMDSATFVDGELKIAFAAIAGSYEGSWDAEKGFIDGIWSQGGGSVELDLKRAVEEEEGEENG